MFKKAMKFFLAVLMAAAGCAGVQHPPLTIKQQERQGVTEAEQSNWWYETIRQQWRECVTKDHDDDDPPNCRVLEEIYMEEILYGLRRAHAQLAKEAASNTK